MSDIHRQMDSYLEECLLPKDNVLEAALEQAGKAELPPIAVSPLLGQFLNMLVTIHGAARIIEIGTLAGYSTICLARALPPGGRLYSLELNPVCVKVAMRNLATAGLSEKVTIMEGPAMESLQHIRAHGEAPFDLFFIDADKAGIPAYVEGCLKLARSGSLIVVDNVVRDGEVLDAGSEDPDVQGVRAFLEAAGKDERLQVTALQTVGVKGYDGFALARVL